MVTPSDPSQAAEALAKSLFANGGKSMEKFVLYTLGTLSATNVFGTVHDGNLRYWLTLGISFILGGLHISTPTPKSGPGQL